MRRLVVVMAVLGLVLGIGVALAAVWVWFDPVGVHMANDADPFGTPPSRAESAYIFVFGAVIAVWSARTLGFWRDDDDGDDDA